MPVAAMRGATCDHDDIGAHKEEDEGEAPAPRARAPQAPSFHPEAQARVSASWLRDAQIAARERCSANIRSTRGVREKRDVQEACIWQETVERDNSTRDGSVEGDFLLGARHLAGAPPSSSSEGLVDSRERLVRLTKPGHGHARAIRGPARHADDECAGIRHLAYCDDEGDQQKDRESFVNADDAVGERDTVTGEVPALPGGSLASALDPPAGIAGLPETWVVRPLQSSLTQDSKLGSVVRDGFEQQMHAEHPPTTAPARGFPEMVDTQYDDVLGGGSSMGHDDDGDDGDDDGGHSAMSASVSGSTAPHNSAEAEREGRRETTTTSRSQSPQVAQMEVVRPAPNGAIAGLPETWQSSDGMDALPTADPDEQRARRSRPSKIPGVHREEQQYGGESVPGEYHAAVDGNESGWEGCLPKEREAVASASRVEGAPTCEERYPPPSSDETGQRRLFSVPIELDDLEEGAAGGGCTEHDGPVGGASADSWLGLERSGARQQVLSREIASARLSARLEWEDRVAHHERTARIAERRAERAEVLTQRLTRGAMLAREEARVQCQHAEEAEQGRERAEAKAELAIGHAEAIERLAIDHVASIADAERAANAMVNEIRERYRVAVDEIDLLQRKMAEMSAERDDSRRESQFIVTYIHELRARIKVAEEEAASQRGLRAAAEKTVDWWEQAAKDGRDLQRLEERLRSEKDAFLKIARLRKEHLSRIHSETKAETSPDGAEALVEGKGQSAAKRILHDGEGLKRMRAEHAAAARGASRARKEIEETLLSDVEVPMHLRVRGLLYRAIVSTSPLPRSEVADSNLGQGGADARLAAADGLGKGLMSLLGVMSFRSFRGSPGVVVPPTVVARAETYVLVDPCASLCRTDCVAELFSAFEARVSTRLLIVVPSAPESTSAPTGPAAEDMKMEVSARELFCGQRADAAEGVGWFMHAWRSRIVMDRRSAIHGDSDVKRRMTEWFGMNDISMALLSDADNNRGMGCRGVRADHPRAVGRGASCSRASRTPRRSPLPSITGLVSLHISRRVLDMASVRASRTQHLDVILTQVCSSGSMKRVCVDCTGDIDLARHIAGFVGSRWRDACLEYLAVTAAAAKGESLRWIPMASIFGPNKYHCEPVSWQRARIEDVETLACMIESASEQQRLVHESTIRPGEPVRAGGSSTTGDRCRFQVDVISEVDDRPQSRVDVWIDACRHLAAACFEGSFWVESCCGVAFHRTEDCARPVCPVSLIGVAALAHVLAERGIGTITHEEEVQDARGTERRMSLRDWGLSPRGCSMLVKAVCSIAETGGSNASGTCTVHAVDLGNLQLGPHHGRAILRALLSLEAASSVGWPVSSSHPAPRQSSDDPPGPSTHRSAGQPTLRSLVLDGCGLTDACCSTLADVLICCGAIEELDISGNRLSNEGIAAIAEVRVHDADCTGCARRPLLPPMAGAGDGQVDAGVHGQHRGCRLRRFSVAHNSVSLSGAASLASAMRATREIDPSSWSPLAHVSCLDLSHNASINHDAVKVIAESLRDGAPSLVELSLCRCHVGTEGADAIANALIVRCGLGRSPLAVLDVGGCTLQWSGMARLAHAFAYIEDLRASKNALGDKGAAAIASALQQATSPASGAGVGCPVALTRLDLSGNLIGREGGRRLIDSLRKASTRSAKLQCPGKTLRTLVVRNNKLEKEQEKTLSDLQKLRELAPLHHGARSATTKPKRAGLSGPSNGDKGK